jgi:hypothetical protein
MRLYMCESACVFLSDSMGNELSNGRRPGNVVCTRKLHNDNLVRTPLSDVKKIKLSQPIGAFADTILSGFQDSEGVLKFVNIEVNLGQFHNSDISSGEGIRENFLIVISLNVRNVPLIDVDDLRRQQAQIAIQFAAINTALMHKRTAKVAVKFITTDEDEMVLEDATSDAWEEPLFAFLTAFWNNDVLQRKLTIVAADSNKQLVMLLALESIPLDALVKLRTSDLQQGRTPQQIHLRIDMSLLEPVRNRTVGGQRVLESKFTDWLLDVKTSPMRIFSVVQFTGVDPRFYQIMNRIVPNLTDGRGGQYVAFRRALITWVVREVRVFLGNVNTHLFRPPLEELADDPAELWQLERLSRRDRQSMKDENPFEPTPEPAMWEVNTVGRVKSTYLQDFIEKRAGQLSVFKEAFGKLLRGTKKTDQFAPDAKLTTFENLAGPVPQTLSEHIAQWSLFPVDHFVTTAARTWSDLNLVKQDVITIGNSIILRSNSAQTQLENGYALLVAFFFHRIGTLVGVIRQFIVDEHDYLPNFIDLADENAFVVLSARKTELFTAVQNGMSVLFQGLVFIINNGREHQTFVKKFSMRATRGVPPRETEVTTDMLTDRNTSLRQSIKEIAFPLVLEHLTRILELSEIIKTTGNMIVTTQSVVSGLVSVAEDIANRMFEKLEIDEVTGELYETELSEDPNVVNFLLKEQQSYLIATERYLFALRKTIWKFLDSGRIVSTVFGEEVPAELLAMVALQGDMQAPQLVNFPLASKMDSATLADSDAESELDEFLAEIPGDHRRPQSEMFLSM